MTNIQEIYQEKVNRFELTQRGKIPDRVPVFCNVDNGAFSYAGYTAKEIFEDDEKHLASFVKVAKDFYWDSMYTAVTSKAMNFISALGGGSYKLDDANMQVETGHADCMEPSEYDQLIADPYGFILNVVAPRKYELMRMAYSDEKQQKFNNAVDYFTRFQRLNAQAAGKFINELGMPLVKSGYFSNPVDILLGYLRDFKGITMDIKRNPAKVAEAADAFVPVCIELVEAVAPAPVKGKSIFNPLNLPPFLKPKDFEKVYWPTYNKLVNYFAQKGYVVLSYYERNFSHLFDYLQELPANAVLGMFEDDDIRIAKQKLGKNMCIAGGMDLYLLNHGTKQQCLDMAKSLIDDLAPGGNYIFTANRTPHSAGDIHYENFKAVNDFVHEYGVYR